MIRDVALAASGLLTQKIGGPSVFPPQPPGVWDLPYNDDLGKRVDGPIATGAVFIRSFVDRPRIRQWLISMPLAVNPVRFDAHERILRCRRLLP